MMLSPGFTNCQSDPLGHTHDALLESSPSNVTTVRMKHQLMNQLIHYFRISRVQALPEAELLRYLQRQSSLATQAPSCRTRSPGQPQVFWQPGESKHSVSPWKSEQERGQGLPQGHSSFPPAQSAEGSYSHCCRGSSVQVQKSLGCKDDIWKLLWPEIEAIPWKEAFTLKLNDW